MAGKPTPESAAGVCSRCKENPRRSYHSWCGRCHREYRRDLYWSGPVQGKAFNWSKERQRLNGYDV